MSETTKNVETVKKDITVQVLDKINVFKENGELTIPSNYSPENALKSAYLVLSEQKDKSGKSVLESCTKPSIANALFSMVTWGLSPMKNQVYFIPYGDKLQISKSYLGNVAIAKRTAGVKEVNAVVVYKEDLFNIGVNPKTGIFEVIQHETKLENINDQDIIGGYAVVIFSDGRVKTEIMNIKQVETSWNQGYAKGGSPAHKNFRGEMVKKTIINRALKTVIGASDDSALYEEQEVIIPTAENELKREFTHNANAEVIDFEEIAEQPKETEKEEVKQEVEEPKSFEEAGF
jgi:recombination protein RecT